MSSKSKSIPLAPNLFMKANKLVARAAGFTLFGKKVLKAPPTDIYKFYKRPSALAFRISANILGSQLFTPFTHCV